jgi:hypothetical protein
MMAGVGAEEPKGIRERVAKPCSKSSRLSGIATYV